MPNSKRRRKDELVPITYDELLSDSSMRGLISFLEVKPGVAPEVPEDATTLAASSGAPELTAPALTALNIGAPKHADGKVEPPYGAATETRTPEVIPFPGLVPPIQGAPARARNLGAPNVGSPNSSAPTSGVPEAADQSTAPETALFDLDSPEIVYRRPQEIIREARYAQDGHTIGEQRLYDTLWRLGRPVASQARAVTIGERTLAGQANMSYSAIQDNARSLARKLGIEVRAATSKNAPKTYVVFSYEEILRRRRAAGLTHYLRRTSAVELVDPRKIGAPSSGAPLFDQSNGNVFEAETDINAGASSVGAPELNVPTFPHEVLSALRKTLMKADDDAALRIVAECRKVAPDVTNAEVAELILTDAPLIARNKNIQNPIGVLIRHIPRCCGENLRQIRAEKVRWQAENTARLNRERDETRRIAKLTLDDPSATPDERAWAETILAE